MRGVAVFDTSRSRWRVGIVIRSRYGFPGGGGGTAGSGAGSNAGSAGTANTGGGGGGSNVTSGAGGSGIIILRYPATQSATLSGGATGSVDQPITGSTDKYAEITGSGTITFS